MRLWKPGVLQSKGLLCLNMVATLTVSGGGALQAYLSAGKRCGLSDDASGYWALHIKEDERHGRQMLEEVALPLVDM